MKKNITLCPCGSGKPRDLCCQNKIEVKIWSKPFESPQEREEFLSNLKISAEFNMRHRGLLQYYGKDLIAYKLCHYTSKNCNEFLRIFSEYMTSYLEDNCPPGWDQCGSPFWEEFIFTYIPFVIKITPSKNEAEKFLYQLKSFVLWLDKRAGTSWSNMVHSYAVEASPALFQCEQLLNHLILTEFPDIHQSDWRIEQASEIMNRKLQAFTGRLDSIFQVSSILEDTATLTELKTGRDYHLKGMPCSLIHPGMLLDGVMVKRTGAMFWNWFLTNSVFPERAGKYIMVV